MNAARFAAIALTVVAIALGVILLPGTAAAQQSAPNCTEVGFDGAGTVTDPYQVGNVSQLQCVGHANSSTTLGDNFTLVSDIDASPTQNWNGGEGFAPIGEFNGSYEKIDRGFSGTFDGTGHVVTDLFINRSEFIQEHKAQGLFVGLVDGGVVKNLGVEDVDITGSRFIGAIAANNSNGTIRNTYATGRIETVEHTMGGLVGENLESASVIASHTDVTLRTPDGTHTIGGLVGENRGNVTRSHTVGFVNASITDSTYVGGLVGDNPGGIITNSSATGNVTGYYYAGGLVGDHDKNGVIRSSYATGDVFGPNGPIVGGLVGGTDDPSLVIDSYATGDVVSYDEAGGIAGYNNGELRNVSAHGDVAGCFAGGGLVGWNDGSGNIVRSAATGNVTHMQRAIDGNWGCAFDNGGLVGYNKGQISWSYATGTVAFRRAESVGGLVGHFDSGSVEASYATGDVVGDAEVGGLVGIIDPGLVDESYSFGTVAGNTSVGGLVGLNNDTVSNSYWDVDASGQSTSAGGTGLNTSQMRGTAAETNMTAFDFASTWDSVETPEDGFKISYPVLQDNRQDPEPGLRQLYAGGNGSAANPYQLATWRHLDNVRLNLDRNYTLIADIDQGASGYTTYVDSPAKGFDPIGTSDSDNDTEFTGSLTGAGFTVGDLRINRSNESYVGLFGGTLGATFEEVALRNVSILGSDVAGGLAGNAIGSTVTGSSVSGHVATPNGTSGDSDGDLIIAPGVLDAAGGLIGHNFEGVVRDSFAAVNVTGRARLGGLVGKSQRSTVTNSVATGDVDGYSMNGGLIGRASGGEVRNSFASGDVGGYRMTGGLVGAHNGSITDSYATGDVGGYRMTGGLVGIHNGLIAHSYATGSVSGGRVVGGLVGYARQDGTIHGSNATGDVRGDEVGAGGLLGYTAGNVTQSYATGNVSGDTYVGGAVGVMVPNQPGSLVRVNTSYATGTVAGNDSVGGFTGYAENASITQTYAVGPVEGNYSVGGLLGLSANSTIGASYWDVEATGQNSSAGGTGLNTSQMLGDDAETQMTQFDFANTWHVVYQNLNDGYEVSYPYLVDNHQVPEPGLRIIYGFLDVKIQSVTTPVTVGQPVQVTATVENTGRVPTSQELRLRDAGFENLQRDSTAVSLAEGEAQTYQLVWSDTFDTVGQGPVKVATDDDAASRSVQILDPAYFGVEIVDTNGPVRPTQTLTVTAEIRNTGGQPASQQVAFDVADENASRSISLGPDEATEVTFEWPDPTAADRGSHTATVETAQESASSEVSVIVVPPEYVSGEILEASPRTITATFDQDVSLAAASAASGFTVTVDDEPVDIAAATAVGQDTVELELAERVWAGETVRISYDGNSDNVVNGNGVEALDFVDATVDNLVETELAVVANLTAIDVDVDEPTTTTSVEEPVEFSALDSYVPPGYDVTYTWEVEGESITTQEPVLPREFLEPGTITANVTISAGDLSDTASFTLDVVDQTAPQVELTADSPIQVAEDPGLDASESEDNVGIATYEWEFGDGSTAEGPELTNPDHSYDEPGEYEVTVTVTDAGGNRATNSTTVVVEAAEDSSVVDTSYLWLLLLLVVLVIVAVYYRSRRREEQK